MPDEPETDKSVYELDFADGCDLDFTENPTPDEEVDLLTLFAEGLDPSSPKTVEQVKGEWEELFDAPS